MTVAFLLPTPVFLLDFLLFFFFHPLDLIPLDFTGYKKRGGEKPRTVLFQRLNSKQFLVPLCKLPILKQFLLMKSSPAQEHF